MLVGYISVYERREGKKKKKKWRRKEKNISVDVGRTSKKKTL